jgi:hypothetical protein
MGMCVWDLETCDHLVLTSTKIRRRRKKSLAKVWQKIKTTFWGHESFSLFKLKMQYFVQESAAKFTIFYLLYIKFFKNLVFLTDTVADLALRYTLCGRYTVLCAPTVYTRCVRKQMCRAT